MNYSLEKQDGQTEKYYFIIFKSYFRGKLAVYCGKFSQQYFVVFRGILLFHAKFSQ